MPRLQTTTTNELALELIDQATAATTKAIQAGTNPQAKEHLEYARALVTESWIAEDGQQARDPQTIVTEVKNSFALFDTIAGITGKEGK